MVEFLLPFIGAFLVNRRDPTTVTRIFDPGHTKIRCPLCHWQPRKEDRWFCEPGCYHHWNTFDTAGVCPRCAKQWDETACLRCRAWSRHADWYEPEGDNGRT